MRLGRERSKSVKKSFRDGESSLVEVILFVAFFVAVVFVMSSVSHASEKKHFNHSIEASRFHLK